MKTCTPIFTPRNNTIYDLIFEPTMIDRPSSDLVGYLRDKINSNHKLPVIGKIDLLEMWSNAATNSGSQSDYTTSLDHVINKGMAAQYNVTSIFDKFRHLMVLSACYRMLQILSISLQHKIALSNYRKATKFILTAFSALTPFAVMSFMGYYSSELIIVSLLTSISPYILSNRWSNKIREIDLISTTKDFIFTNSLLNCCLSSIRNISSTLLIDLAQVLFLSSVYFISSNASVFNHLIVNALSIRHDVEVCRFTQRFDESSYGQSVFTPAHFITHLLMFEAGWCLGRLMIDLGMGLLQKANIISDARDPFYNSTFKVKGRPSKPEHMPKQPGARRLKGKERLEGVEAREYVLAPQDRQRVKKPKKQAEAAQHENKNQAQTEIANMELPIIQVPGYPEQPLVPFYPSSQSQPTYGVVANTKMRQFSKFTTTLNKAHNRDASPNGFIECLDTGKQVFSLRPNNSDARALGQKVTGQEAVASALESVYNYEQVWVAMDKMVNPKLVPFTKETNHAQQNSVIARFA